MARSEQAAPPLPSGPWTSGLGVLIDMAPQPTDGTLGLSYVDSLRDVVAVPMEGSTAELQITQHHQDVRIESTVWPAAIAMASNMPAIVAGAFACSSMGQCCVLELGAGTGVGACAAAAHGALLAIATDLPSCMAACEMNARAFAQDRGWQDISATLPTTVCGWMATPGENHDDDHHHQPQLLLTMPLDWSNLPAWDELVSASKSRLPEFAEGLLRTLRPSHATLAPPAPQPTCTPPSWLVLAAECVYSDTPSLDFTRMCSDLVQARGMRMLLAYRRRLPAAEVPIWQAIAALGCVCQHAPAQKYYGAADEGCWLVALSAE